MIQPVSLIISFYNKIELLKFIFAALDRQSYRNFEHGETKIEVELEVDKESLD